jgi:hypothetical protein
MFNRAQDQGGQMQSTADIQKYFEDWSHLPNAEIEAEGTF